MATRTEHGSDESGFPVFKGSLQRGGWLSTCSARGADLHRLFGDMSKQSGLQSGTEGETGRSHNRGTDERETENGSGASRTGGENGVVGDLGSEFLALVR